MRHFLFIAPLALFACDTASPAFYGTTAHRVSAGGSDFTLRFRDNLAEAIRTNPEMLPRFDRVALRAALAVQQVKPQCYADWIRGDPSMMVMGLACDGLPAPKAPRKALRVICDGDLGTPRPDNATCRILP